MPVVIVPIRNDNSYFGFAKETTPGTPVAPSLFPRWQDGSTITIELKAEDVWEGDGTRRLSQIVKNQQYVKLKLVVLPRMNEIGFFESLALGANSDTVTTVAPSTTLSAGVTGGTSTSVTVPVNTGLTGAGTIQMLVGAGTATAETVPFTLPATGAGPYTLTVAASYNGGKLKNNHSSADPIASIATVNTSVAATSTVGATTIQLANNAGLTGSGTSAVVLSPGTANEEIASLVTPGTGAGPYTYTVANSGTLKNVHTLGDAATSPVIHTLTDQTDGNYCTIEVGLGSLYGAAGTTLRVRSCKCDTIKRSGKSGGIWTYEMEFTGIASSVQITPATLTFEPHPVFLYTQGVWTVDGSTAGDALNIEQCDIAQKNGLDMTQTEALTLAALNFGNIAVDVGFDLVYINGNRIYQTYFGGTSGTTDAQAIGLGAFSVTFSQPDGFQSVTYTVPTTAYTKVGMPAPKKDGKHFTQQMSATGTSNQGSNAYLMQVTVNNTQYSPN